MSELIINRNSLYSQVKGTFLVSRDVLEAVARSLSAINASIYGFQPTWEQISSGITPEDLSGSSLCSDVILLNHNVNALKFFSQTPFKTFDSEEEMKANAKDLLTIYLTPISVDNEVLSNRCEWLYVFPSEVSVTVEDNLSVLSGWDILEYAYNQADNPDFRLSDLSGGEWEIIGTTSIHDEDILKIWQAINTLSAGILSDYATMEWSDKKFVALSGEESLSGNLSVSHKLPNPSYAYNNKIVLSSSFNTSNEMYMYCFEENPITTLQRDSSIVYSVISGIWDQSANRYLRCEERKLTAHADISIFDNENYTKNAVATIQLSAPWIYEYSQPQINIEAYEVPSELTYNLTSVNGLIQLQYTSGSFYRFTYADMKGFNDTQNVGGQDGIDAVYAYFDSCWVYEIPEFIEEIDRFALMTDILSSIEPINILLSTDFPKVSADAINALKEKKFIEWQLSSNNLFAGKNNAVETGTRPTDAPHHNIVFGRNNVLSNQYKESDWYGDTGRINKTIVIGNDNSIKGRSEPLEETIDISYNVIGNNNSISTDGVLTAIHSWFDKNLEIFGNNLSVFNSNNSIILGNDFKANNVSKKMIVGSSNAFELVDLENGNIPYARLSANVTGQALGILNRENKIADGLVITSSMLSNSINGDRIVSNTMSGAKIKSGTISGEKLQDGLITTNKLRDNAVTPEKLDRAYVALSDYETLSSDFISKSDLSSALLDLSNVVDFNYGSIENENSILSLAHNVGVLQTVLSNIQQLLS